MEPACVSARRPTTADLACLAVSLVHGGDDVAATLHRASSPSIDDRHHTSPHHNSPHAGRVAGQKAPRKHVRTLLTALALEAAAGSLATSPATTKSAGEQDTTNDQHRSLQVEHHMILRDGSDERASLIRAIVGHRSRAPGSGGGTSSSATALHIGHSADEIAFVDAVMGLDAGLRGTRHRLRTLHAMIAPSSPSCTLYML